MVDVFKKPITADQVKAKGIALGADLVGIADGKAMNAFPPDPRDPRRPSDLSDLDADRVIVLAKRCNSGSTRLARWNDRHKLYNDELALASLEETVLELICWLEECGYPAIAVPPTYVDRGFYRGDPAAHMTTILSLSHAAVEAGLGTLGLNLQLITPQFGPRVLLAAALSSVPVQPDRRMEQTLCLGPSCGRCLKACPGDVVGHWDRDWQNCDRYRSPQGFAHLVEHITRAIEEPDPERQKALVRSEESFNLWQSMLRGSGINTGCRRCQDVCPVGADYTPMLKDALDEIPEATPAKQARLDAMAAAEARGERSSAGQAQTRWIGELSYLKPTP
jgi:ferredoxin